MKAKYESQHEEAELSADITKNYQLYKNQLQERNKRGRLTDPLAQTFEQRMNRSLESYLDLARATGHAIISSAVEQ